MKLHDAAKAGNTAEVIRLLTTSGILRRKADVNEKDDGMTALMWAACEGHAETVQALIDAGADMEIKQYGGSTALILAAGKGHTETVQALIKAGAIIDAQQRESWTALMYAACEGHTKIVQALLKAGAKADIKNKVGVTALDLAIESNHSAVVSLLKTAAKKPALVVAASGSAHGGAGYRTSDAGSVHKESLPVKGKSTKLWEAARDGDIIEVKRLLTASANVDEQDPYGQTALMWAAQNGKAEVVQALLTSGANIEAKINNGRTALMYAACEGQTKTVRVLLEAGAKIESQDRMGKTALALAAFYGDTETVQALLAVGAKLESQDKEGRTALISAAKEGEAQVVQALLLSGASIEALDNNGETALILAALSGHKKVIEILLAAGAKVDVKNKKGRVALDLAIENNHLEVISLLLQAAAKKTAPASNPAHGGAGYSTSGTSLPSKISAPAEDKSRTLWVAARDGDIAGINRLLSASADVNLLNRNSNTPLMCAIAGGQIESVKVLLAAGANTESQDDYGRTALILAALRGKIKIVQALLISGANIEMLDNNGETALMWAAWSGHKETVEVLLAAGAKADIKNKKGRTALDLAIEKNHSEVISLLQSSAKKSAPAATISHASSVTASVASTTSKVHGGAGQSSDGANSSAKAVVPTPASYSVIPYSKLQFTGNVLGEGGFGIVKEAKWNYMDVAVKQFKAVKLADDALLELENEAKRHAALRFPTIVQLYGVCLEAFKYCMVMELMVGGSLYDVLHNGKELPWPVRLSIAKDIAAGLSYLHENGILHRDLKSLNVLLDDRMRAKLSDFGLSKVKTESTIATAGSKQAVGTLNWKAPELFKMGSKYSELTDIYALGQVLWEIASRKVPFHEANGEAEVIKDWIKEGSRDEIPAETPPKYATLIQQCWAQDPKSRPQAAGEIAEALSQYQVATVMPAHGGAGRSDRPADSVGNKLFS